MSDYEDTSFIANGPDGEMHWYSDESEYARHWQEYEEE